MATTLLVHEKRDGLRDITSYKGVSSFVHDLPKMINALTEIISWKDSQTSKER